MRLELTPIRPRLDRISLDAALTRLSGLSLHTHPLADRPGATPSREANMIERLKSREPHESFAEVTRGIGRELILLNLYLQFCGRNDAVWLPPFNSEVAQSILGPTGRAWHSARRRLATQFFFTHFDSVHLPALDLLCGRLIESHEMIDPGDASEELKVRHLHRREMFSPDGPAQVAAAAQPGETLTELMDRFAIPREIGAVQLSGKFAERLKECFLLTRLQAAELGAGQDVLRQIETVRELPFQAGVPMGAAALRILTQRTLQAGGVWKGDWVDWLLKLGSDPALPNSAEYRKWWACWNPTPAELECARRGLKRKTLEYFIRFLEDSLEARDQFTRRAKFLRWLDESGKIIDFKLLLHPSAYDTLPREYRQQRNRIARLDGSDKDKSVIVFQCIDDVWIVEGTHDFAIRMFRTVFPERVSLAQDWEYYDYASFTQGPMHKNEVEQTGIYKRHQGDWESDLLWRMQYRFHIEPPWRYR